MNPLRKLDRTICRIIDSPRTKKLGDIIGIVLIAAIFASAYWWL